MLLENKKEIINGDALFYNIYKLLNNDMYRYMICIYYIKITCIALLADIWLGIDPTVCQKDDRFSQVMGKVSVLEVKEEQL